ncbi:MAG: RNA polymerase sigma factor [Verrucomicrobiota bacterium]
MNTRGADAAAVAAVRKGDAERYRELVERHEQRVYAVAWSRLGDATLAEEATQEAFIRGYRRLWLLGDASKFAAWITSISRHVAINLGLRHRRELNKRERWALEQPAAPTIAAEETAPSCSPETLRAALEKLPAKHRECLVLFYLEGKSGNETALALGISEATLRVRLHRARVALRNRLDEQLQDSLRQLKPSRTLVPMIMTGVLASSSANAATTGGATFLGALMKLGPFKWLGVFSAALIGALPSMAFTALAARAEQRNFRDPEDFRAKAQRAMYRKILLVVPLVTIPFVFGLSALNAKLGARRFDFIIALFLVGLFAFQCWRLGLRNRAQRGILIWYAIPAGGMLLRALGLIPASAYSYFCIAGFLWLMWVIRQRPMKMDNSLFLRAMMGSLMTPASERVVAQTDESFSKAELIVFGRFLNDRHLVNDFRWNPDGLLLRQSFHQQAGLGMQPARFSRLSLDSSNIQLHWRGEVSACFSEADQRSGRMLKPEETTTRRQVEEQVALAVAYAWQEFRRGNLVAADGALGEKPDAEIFLVPPARAASTRWLQAMLALPVILFTGMLIWERQPHLLREFLERRNQAHSSINANTNSGNLVPRSLPPME